jgi:ABC-type amino acid transport substrate-binding protein
VFRRHARRADCDALIGAVVTLGGQKEEGRHGRMLLSKPYAGSGYVLMVSRESSGVYRFEDLKGSKIGVQHTSWPHYLLDTRKIPVASYLDPMEILEAIAKGEISAGLVPDPYVGWYLKQHPEGAVKIAEAYMPDTELRWNVAISLRNADEALREAVNQALNQMLATQMIQKIFAKYGVTYIPPFKE